MIHFVSMFIGSAYGQAIPVDPDNTTPHPQHIIVPDPLDQPENQNIRRKGGKRYQRPDKPKVPPRITRKVPRPVRGSAPKHLHGRYQVVEVTEGGVTEQYRNKMERAGRSLNADCIIIRTIYDFGMLPEEPGDQYRPEQIELTRVQTCEVGGLGTYAEELTLVVDATYIEGDDVVTIELPRAYATADYVRLRKPTEGDMPTPPQWLAPQTKMDRNVQRLLLVAEPRRRGLPVLHLTTEDKVWHLEADTADSPFDVADRQSARLTEEASP